MGESPTDARNSAVVATLQNNRARLVSDYQQKVAGQPTALNGVAKQYQDGAQRVAQIATTVDKMPDELKPDWHGDGYNSFSGAIKRDVELTGVANALAKLGTELSNAGTAVQTAMSAMDNVLRNYDSKAPAIATANDQAAANKLGVDSATSAAQISNTLNTTLGQIADRLRPLVPVAQAGHGAGLPVDIGSQQPPTPGTDPKRVKAWWDSLSPAQKQWFSANYPHQIGALDGIPAADRDTANRTYLKQYLDNPANAKDPQYAATQQLYDRLAQSPDHLYLLNLDPKATGGRATVAVGNPDNANYTAVIVPGINTPLSGVPANITRAENLAQTAGALTDKPISTIVDLGYESPQALKDGGTPSATGGWDAITKADAQAGAPVLHNFVDGLRSTNTTGSDTITMVPHSYGSLVTGLAASDPKSPLAADNIVPLGSPGMGVANVDKLYLSGGSNDPNVASDHNVADHVYVLAHPDDFIANSPGGVLNSRFGTAPQSAAFHASVINDLEPPPDNQLAGAHTSYLNPDPRAGAPTNTSRPIGDLNAVANVMVGNGSKVPLVSGRGK